jgi:hypothetical protein
MDAASRSRLNYAGFPVAVKVSLGVGCEESLGVGSVLLGNTGGISIGGSDSVGLGDGGSGVGVGVLDDGGGGGGLTIAVDDGDDGLGPAEDRVVVAGVPGWVFPPAGAAPTARLVRGVVDVPAAGELVAAGVELGDALAVDPGLVAAPDDGALEPTAGWTFWPGGTLAWFCDAALVSEGRDWTRCRPSMRPLACMIVTPINASATTRAAGRAINNVLRNNGRSRRRRA